MRHAGVLKWKSQYLIHADSIDRRGLLSPSPPYLSLAASATDKELGQALMLALSGSSFAAPAADHKDDGGRPLLQLARVGSWAELETAANVSIEHRRDGTVSLIPMRRSGRRFEALKQLQITLRRFANHEQLGSALKKAIALAQAHAAPAPARAT